MPDRESLQAADREFVRIAIFNLDSCSNAMLEISEQTDSRGLRRRLFRLARDLAAKGDELMTRQAADAGRS
jgi:hypothetical protein